TDLFNRWQTAQEFALKHLAEMAREIAAGNPARGNTRFVQAAGSVAGDASLEHAYRAAFLTLPPESAGAQAIGHNATPNALYTPPRPLRSPLGRTLRATLENVYEQSAPPEPYTPGPQSAGRRALRQAALSLLAAGKSRFGIAKVKEQARTATNMTEAF